MVCRKANGSVSLPLRSVDIEKTYAIYPINQEKLPQKGATPTCKKCGVAFTIVKATGDPVKDRAQRMKGYVQQQIAPFQRMIYISVCKFVH
jgi:hypothetical protein